MSVSLSRSGRSIAVILGIVVLLTSAVVYAAIAALFGLLLSLSTGPGTTIAVLRGPPILDFRGGTVASIGDMRLTSEFSLHGLLIFGLLCLLSAYGGLASIWRWPRWLSVARAAGWATLSLSLYGISTYLTLVSPAGPLWFPPVGIMMPIDLSLAAGVAAVLVLLAIRKPAAGSP